MPASIQALQPAHLPEAIALWRDMPGIGLSPEETPTMLTAYLQRNLDISSAAIDEDGTLVGAIMGGHDGRRGFLYHLAVKESHRGQKLGRLLVQRTTAELAKCGIVKAAIMVYTTNREGRAFWEHLGWNIRTDLYPMQVALL